MLSLLETVASFIKRLLLMGNQKVRRIKLINQIKEKLAEYEDYFYRNNLKVDSDARDLLLKIDDFLNKWEWFYLGFIRWESKEVDLKDVQHVELLLKELSYISLYKRFEKYTQRVVVVDSLFQIMKEKKKIARNYTFEKFHNEMTLLAKQKYINFEKFIINRIFPGENYAFLKSYNKVEYNFQLMKTYGMYHFLYVYGSLENKTIKVGISTNNLSQRYCEAKGMYDHKFFTNDFGEIKIIESLNALNLESYLKRKFKHQRHPLFHSSEWFLLSESELRYFTNNEYQKDKDFMKIFNYNLDV
ncbi:GIY-YIG nuclease family protein [Peribacillus sp. FSL K6-1552]|uniref:GIY-YIG nuclease family protein n=1 Tax=Peribacillus sp. FSL K6-1552 TaxID=2954514 RepID=UPI0030F664AB